MQDHDGDLPETPHTGDSTLVGDSPGLGPGDDDETVNDLPGCWYDDDDDNDEDGEENEQVHKDKADDGDIDLSYLLITPDPRDIDSSDDDMRNGSGEIDIIVTCLRVYRNGFCHISQFISYSNRAR